MRTAGRRAATSACARWARALRRALSRLDLTDSAVRRHPSRHSFEGARRVAAPHDDDATMTLIAGEYRLEDLLEEWGRSA